MAVGKSQRLRSRTHRVDHSPGTIQGKLPDRSLPAPGQSCRLDRRERISQFSPAKHKEVGSFLQCLETRLEPNLCDKSGYYGAANDRGQKDGVLNLIDYMIGRAEGC